MSLIDVVQQKVQGYFNHLSGPSYVRLLDTPHVWGLPFGKEIMPQSWVRQAEFARAIEEIVQKSRYRCDVASLNSPDPDWVKVIMGAMDTALTKSMGRSGPTQFRFLFGQTPLNAFTDPANYNDFKAALIRLVRARSSSWEKMPEIWMGRFYRLKDGILSALQAKAFGENAFSSDDTKMTWNHAKIIVVDGTEAMAGGHNLNMDLFRSYPPVHDVSVVVHGEAAYGSQLFLNNMWACGVDLLTKEYLDTTTLKWVNGDNDSAKPADPLTSQDAVSYMANAQRTLVQMHQSGTQSGTDTPPAPPNPPNPSGIREQDLQTLADLQLEVFQERITYNTYDKFQDYKLATRMLALGKYWTGPNRDNDYKKASEIMKEELIKGAQSTIRMSQMDLVSAWKKNWSDHVVCQWLMAALLANKNLRAHVVVSPLDAGAGAEGDQYSFGSGASRTFDLITYYMTHDVNTDAPLPDTDGSRAEALTRLQIAPLYYTDLVPAELTAEGTTYKWPDLSPEGYTATLKQLPLSEKPPKQGVIGSAAMSVLNASGYIYFKVPSAPGNHAKITIVDDNLYVVGSDNLYPGSLSEFNYMIEGDAAVGELLASYWNPLWRYSGPHATARSRVEVVYLNQLKEFLETEFPVKAGLWNYSNDNALASDWLLASPFNVWGTPYANFKQAVASDTATAGFKLATCSSETSPTQQCYPLQSTVLKPGDAPVSLLVGHSDALIDAINDIVRSGRIFVDVTTLSAPTGRFLTAIRNAITYISHKPANERPIIRVLYSRWLGAVGSLSAKDLLTQITSGADPSQNVEIYVGRIASAINSWNHSKIVAADGNRTMVGGHNMWEEHYLGINPVHDVSMRLSGSAAEHAQDFADLLWRFAIKSMAGQSSWWKFAESASYTFNSAQGKGVITDGGLPDVEIYTRAKQRFQSSSSGSTPVIAAGRKAAIAASDFLPTGVSYFDGNGEPSDRAYVKLVELAQRSVRMSLQALQSPEPSLDSFPSTLFPWPTDLFMAIGAALGRGVRFQVVLSNPGAVAGGLTAASAPYTGDAPSSVNRALLSVMVSSLGFEEIHAKTLITEQFRVANFRFSADEAYKKSANDAGVPIPLHAKTMIVDDTVFCIGSQNLYLCNLNEFSYIVEDEAVAQSYVQQYWASIWEQSQRTATADYSDDVLQEQLGEAVLFVLELQRNRRLYQTWSSTLAERRNFDSDADRRLTERYLSEIITNAGFNTRPAMVRDALQAAIFTDRQNTAATQDARNFVQAINSDPKLLQEFADVLAAQDGKSDSDANAAIDAFFAQKGYKCTALQVSAAFNAMRNEMLQHWQGEYQGWVKADNGVSYSDFTPHDDDSPNPRRFATASLGATDDDAVKTVDGPTLTVIDNVTFKIGDDVITSFDYSGGVLTWSQQGAAKTSGSVTFSSITRPGLKDPFVGSEFFGTITFPSDATGPYKGTYSFYGRFGHGIDADDPTDTPISWPFWIGIGVAALAFLGVLFLIRKPVRERVKRWLDQRRDWIERGRYKKLDGKEPTDDQQVDRDVQDPSVRQDRKARNRRRRESFDIELVEISDIRGNDGQAIDVLSVRNSYEFQQAREGNVQKVQEAAKDLPWDFFEKSFQTEIAKRVQDSIEFDAAFQKGSPLEKDLATLTKQITEELREAPQQLIEKSVMSAIQLPDIDPGMRRALVGSEIVQPAVERILSEKSGTSFLEDSVRSAVATQKSHYLAEHVDDLQRQLTDASKSVSETSKELDQRSQALEDLKKQIEKQPQNEELQRQSKDLQNEIDKLVEQQKEQQREEEDARQRKEDAQKEKDKTDADEREAERRRAERAGEVFKGE